MSESFIRYDDQEEAIDWISDFWNSSEKMALLEGPAGSGKTTVAIRAVQELGLGSKAIITAPTNKATGVLKEIAGVGVYPRTTYSALGLKPDNRREEKWFKPDEGKRPSWWGQPKLLVMDEASIAGRNLEFYIDEMLSETPAKLLAIGDICQAPPVVVGQYYADTSWAFNRIPLRMTLRYVRRHDSGILEYANYIREGILKGEERKDLWEAPGIVVVDSEEEFQERFMDATRRIGHEARAVAWKNERVFDLNKVGRRAVVSSEDERNTEFGPGERVIAYSAVKDTQGRLRMYRDEEAIVQKVTERKLTRKGIHGEYLWAWELTLLNTSSPEAGSFQVVSLQVPSAVDFNESVLQRKYWKAKLSGKGADWVSFHDEEDCFPDIHLCHALTVHRSQGSSFREVYFDAGQFARNHDPMTAMRLKYVALTRARELVVILRPR